MKSIIACACCCVREEGLLSYGGRPSWRSARPISAIAPSRRVDLWLALLSSCMFVISKDEERDGEAGKLLSHHSIPHLRSAATKPLRVRCPNLTDPEYFPRDRQYILKFGMSKGSNSE